MLQLCLLKRLGVMAGPTLPHLIDNPHPDVDQGSNRYAMGLALRTFALIIGQCPCLFPGRLPGKLMQSIAQRFQAHQVSTCAMSGDGRETLL